MRAEISPSTYLHPYALLRSKLWKEHHKRHRVYTGSGNRGGVIPYSSVVWWIASWADDDEQYKEEQPHKGLFFAGGDELLGGVQSPFSLSPITSLPSHPAGGRSYL